ncbi:MAG TPA: hypothetical protein VGG74_21175 [Kofleriaceae bacterium]
MKTEESMRDVLLKRVRPLVDQFAAEVTRLTVERVERELARLPAMNLTRERVRQIELSGLHRVRIHEATGEIR